jgi:hypothetical protein
VVGAIGVNEVASITAGDPVACPVGGVHYVVARAGEHSVSTPVGEEDVVAAQAVEEVGAAEAA